MAQIGSVTAILNADSSGFVGGVGQAIDTLGDFGSALGASRGSMLALGAAGAAVAAGGLAAATVQAAEFERTIAGAAARAGATQEAFTQFGRAAKQASLDSAFGANEAGGALRFLAKSGFEVEQATAALPGILRGATAAGMGAAEMGEIASNALKAFGRDASETGQVMDVLVKGATSANTSVQELGHGIAIVGGLANEAGMSIESVTSVMASMQDAGVGASRAAVAIRAGLSRLLKPTSDAKAALEALGVNARDAEGNFRGLIPVLSDLEKAGVSSSQMLDIFGRRAGPTLQTALSEGSGALRSFQRDLESADGASRRIAGFIRSSLTEQIKVLAGSIETLGANVGSVLLPPLKLLVGALQVTTKTLNTAVTLAKEAASAIGSVLGQSVSGAKQNFDGFSGSLSNSIAKTETYSRVTRLSAQDIELARTATQNLTTARWEAARASKVQTERTKKLRKRVRSLRKEIDDETNSILQRAKARGELTKAQRELVKAQAEARAPAKGPLLENIESSLQQIEETETRLDNINRTIRDIGPEEVTVPSDATGLFDPRVETKLLSEGERQRLADALAQRRQIRKEIEGQRETLKQSQAEFQKTIDLQKEAGTLGEERKKQIDEQFQRLHQKTSAHRQINESLRERKRLGQEIGEEIAQEPMFNVFGEDAFKKGGPSGRKPGKISKARQRQLGIAGPEQSAAEMITATGAVPTMDEVGSIAGDAASSIGEDLTEKEEKLADERSKSIGQVQNLTGDIVGLTQQMSKASGASQQAVQGIGAVGGALTSVMGGLASGGPFGIISGAIGGLTSLLGLAGGGDSGVQSRARNRRDRREFADMLSDKIVEKQKEVQRPQMNLSIDARGALDQDTPDTARALADMIDQEMRRREL